MAQAKQPFMPKGDFVAGSGGMRFAGRTYAPGASFPWRKLSCSERRLRQLFERRLIEHAQDFDPEKAKQAVEPVDEMPSSTFVFDPKLHNVDADHQVVNEEGDVLLEVDEGLAKKLRKARRPVEIELDEE